jgi:glycosyltransferase involved in cell wall biosynthesis
VLVTPGDARGLADAVERLLGDDALRARIAANAYRQVLDRHDLWEMVEGHRAAFASALDRVAGGRPRAARPAAADDGPARVAHVTTIDLSLRYLLLQQLGTIRERGYAVTGISSPGAEVGALLAAGIAHEAVPMTRRITPLQDLVSLVRLYRTMRRGRFTVVHAHNPKPGLLAQVAARLARVPVVVNTLHGFYFHERSRPAVRRFYVALEKLAARCSDVIFSQNEEDVETALRERIARPGQIRFLGNGIDLSRFDPVRVGPEARWRTRAALGIAEDAPVVGFVGRLVAEKGIGELLEAARTVRARVPETRFLLVGMLDLEKPDHVRPEVAEGLGLGDACVFTGIRQDMPELYRAMDVFVLPSYREGFPRAPMEAAAMRLPCVATDVRGCRQAVAHGRNGLLVPPGAAGALAAAILELLGDPELARRLGEEGRRRAVAEFDERRVFAQVLAEYERLLTEKGLAHRIPPAAEAAALASEAPELLSRAAGR